LIVSFTTPALAGLQIQPITFPEVGFVNQESPPSQIKEQLWVIGSYTQTGQPNITGLGVPFRLAVIGQPTNARGGVTISPPITVQVQDIFGNLCIGVWAIAATLGSNPGPGTLSGTLIQTTSLGIATFNDLSINSPNVANSYSLAFQTVGGLTGTSAAFNITSSAGGTLRTVNSTGVPLTDGATLLSTITGSSSLDVVKVGAGTFDFGTSTCATPDGVSVIGAGQGSMIIKVEQPLATSPIALRVPSSPGVLSNFTLDNSVNDGVSRQPIGAKVGGGQITNGSVVNVTVLGVADAIYIQGVANCSMTFIGCTANAILSDSGFIGGGAAGSVVTLFNVSSSTGAGFAFKITAVAATAIVYYGTLAGGIGAGTLHAGAIINAYGSSVVGSTDDFLQTAGTITEFGCTYRPAFVSGTVGQCNLLVITQQPTTVVHDNVISPSMTVAFQDGLGNIQSVTNGVQVFLNAITGSGVLSGTRTQAAVAGVATFTDLAINQPGTYTLTFAALGMPNITSAQFTVT